MKAECLSSVQQTALSILKGECLSCPERFCGSATNLLEKIRQWYQVCQEPIYCLKTEKRISSFLCLKQIALSQCREVVDCQPIFLGVLEEVAQIGQAAFPEEVTEGKFVITGDGGKQEAFKTKSSKPKIHSASIRLPVWQKQAGYWAEKIAAHTSPLPKSLEETEADCPKEPQALTNRHSTQSTPENQLLKTFLPPPYYLELLECGIRTVDDIQQVGSEELVSLVGKKIQQRVVTRLANHGIVF